jgi:hypothetical protein
MFSRFFKKKELPKSEPPKKSATVQMLSKETLDKHIIPYRPQDFQFPAYKTTNPLTVSPANFQAQLDFFNAEMENLDLLRKAHFREALLSQHPDIIEIVAKSILNSVQDAIVRKVSFPLSVPDTCINFIYEYDGRIAQLDYHLYDYYPSIHESVNEIIGKYGYVVCRHEFKAEYLIYKQQ